MRILVVEDDFGSRRMMQKLLEAWAEVDAVVDGEEALQAFRIAWEEGHPYDLILMDIMMPRMDGHESLKRMRALEKDMGVRPSVETPIIMTTALEDPRNVVEAYYQGGATSYLVKPIERDKLRDELVRLGFSPKA
jgi:two-component system chemotaxis response regulator CheY